MEVASLHHHQMGSVCKIRSRKKGRFLIKTSAQMRNVVEIEAGCISEYKICSVSTSASDLYLSQDQKVKLPFILTDTKMPRTITT